MAVAIFIFKNNMLNYMTVRRTRHNLRRILRMKDMFYNYEHNINRKISPKLPVYDMPKMINVCGNAERLLNAKGDMLGVKGKINSKFYLYFDFVGEVVDDNGLFESTLRDALANSILHFDVLDKKSEVVASFVPELSEYIDEIRVQIFTSEDGPLKYGVYRMHLYFEKEDGIYTLFSDEDGILSIE